MEMKKAGIAAASFSLAFSLLASTLLRPASAPQAPPQFLKAYAHPDATSQAEFNPQSNSNDAEERTREGNRITPPQSRKESQETTASYSQTLVENPCLEERVGSGNSSPLPRCRKDQTASGMPSLAVTESRSLDEETMSTATASVDQIRPQPTTSAYFESPPPACPHAAHLMEKPVDTIVWTSDVDMRYFHQNSWCITVSEHYGIVLEFHEMQMRGADFLEVFSGFNPVTVWRNFSLFSEESLMLLQSQMSFAPLLVKERRIMVRANVFNDQSTRQLSRFNVTYTASPRSSLPSFWPVVDERTTESDVIYNCTGIAELPRAITCDGIRHCERGEDESDCPSNQQGCGDWVPYKDQCLKVVFSRSVLHKPGQVHVTMPPQAEQSCRRKFGATLALLPDSAGIRVATNMILRSGFSNAVVGIHKVRPVSWRLRHLYRYLWQWGEQGSPIAYEQVSLQRTGVSFQCAVLVVLPSPHLKPVKCVLPAPPPQGYVCMRASRHSQSPATPQHAGVVFERASVLPDQFSTRVCPEDHSLVQPFHYCQWQRQRKNDSAEWFQANLRLFRCHSAEEVPYSLLCDGKDDCDDYSDEKGCKRPQYSALLNSSFICRNLQAIPASKRCDGKMDCFDESDEESCVSCSSPIQHPDVGCFPGLNHSVLHGSPSWRLSGSNQTFLADGSGSVTLDGFGMSRLDSTDQCGEGFYACHEGYCIPSFLFNNGEQDCPHGEDEGVLAASMKCPGYYRCQYTGSCVHADYLCDGVYHCPYKDDELFCGETCPHDHGCTCEGQAYRCSQMIDPRQHLHVRYLDMSHASGVSLEHIHFMEYLFFLNLSFCQLEYITLSNMPQLQSLDLSFNSFFKFTDISLNNLSALTFLDLSSNPFVKTKFASLDMMLKLSGFHSLQTLILVNISLESLADNMFLSVPKLRFLDLRDNLILSFGKDSLRGLTALDEMHTDVSKLCCSYFHRTVSRCFAPVDELSSCDDLLAQDFLRVFLWIIALLSIVGNAGVLGYRLIVNSRASSARFSTLVKNLCASDFLMGVYLVMIGLADIHFRGNYVAKESEWTNGTACSVAGFLSFVSTEVSTFVICLITLDRVLVLRFPLKPHLHLSSRVTVCVCCGIWVLSVALAAVPLVLGMDFYGQSSICLPLPITRRPFSGEAFAFGVFVVFNFIIFALVGAGQLLIYRALHSVSSACDSRQRREQDIAISRRLFLVVVTDICCWSPIGVLGLLTASGVLVSSLVHVWVAVFVLPIHSAINPFLYTLDHLRRRCRQPEQQQQQQQQQQRRWRQTAATSTENEHSSSRPQLSAVSRSSGGGKSSWQDSV